MSELPELIRGEVISELYRQAAELDWELLSVSEKKLQYRRWVEDPRIGGRLRAFWDDHRVGTWIKDTPMKEYVRVQEGFGSLAVYAASRYVPGPEPLVKRALGDKWTIKQGSLDEKPMHCVAISGDVERYVCWGKPSTFRDLTWAALDKAIAMPRRPMIIVTTQDGQVVSLAERRLQESIAEHCGIDIRYLPRRIQLIRELLGTKAVAGPRWLSSRNGYRSPQAVIDSGTAELAVPPPPLAPSLAAWTTVASRSLRATNRLVVTVQASAMSWPVVLLTCAGMSPS